MTDGLLRLIGATFVGGAMAVFASAAAVCAFALLRAHMYRPVQYVRQLQRQSEHN